MELEGLEAVRFSIKEVLDYGRAHSPYFNNLLAKAGINNDNYASIIGFADPSEELQVYTVPGSAEIKITQRKRIKEMVIDLTHELTNRTNNAKFERLILELIAGNLTAQAFGEQNSAVEDEGVLNQFLVAKDLKMRKFGSSKHLKFADQILRKFRRGRISEDELKTIIETSSGMNPDTGKKTIDIYMQQAEQILKMIHPEPEDKGIPDKKPKPDKENDDRKPAQIIYK